MNEDLQSIIENTQLQMRKGIIEYCTMMIIGQGKTYANDILKKLKEADLLVVEGTMYPLLSRLKNSGLLTYSWEESKSGPPRKYYELTAEGKVALAGLSQTWHNLSNTIKELEK